MFVRSSHQLVVSDKLASSAHHPVSLQYNVTTTAPDTGYTGYRIPGEGNAYLVPPSGHVYNRLGSTGGHDRDSLRR